MRDFQQMLARAAVTAGLLATAATSARGQLPRTSPADSAAAAATAAVADTGRMMPAYGDMSRYDTPAMCVGAMQGITAHVWRRHEQDTVESQSAADTLPTEAMEKGRACAAQFNVQTMSNVAQLYSLMKLYIMLHDDARTRAVIDRRVALAPNVAARAHVLWSAIDALDNARPIQLEQAKALMVRLDGMGHDARVDRLLANIKMYNAYGAQFDTTMMNHYASNVETITAELTPAERDDYEERFVGSEDPIDFAWYRHDPNLVPIVNKQLDKMLGEMKTFRNGSNTSGYEAIKSFLVAMASRVGQPADTVKGKFWFNAGNTPVRPAPGHVSLFLMSGKGLGTMGGREAMLRRLHDKYASQGLDITLVVRTVGYSWSSPPQTPQVEANADAWYFLNYLKLPVALVVDETPYTTLPDGRREDAMIDFQKHYPLSWGLVGRDGKIRTLSIGYNSDQMLEAFVKEALAH